MNFLCLPSPTDIVSEIALYRRALYPGGSVFQTLILNNRFKVQFHGLWADCCWSIGWYMSIVKFGHVVLILWMVCFSGEVWTHVQEAARACGGWGQFSQAATDRLPGNVSTTLWTDQPWQQQQLQSRVRNTCEWHKLINAHYSCIAIYSVHW